MSSESGENTKVFKNRLKECKDCGECFDFVDKFCHHCGTPLDLSLLVERTIDDKYRLEKMVGKGGMGAVYEAIDLSSNRKIAIKILYMNVDDAILRFSREAKTTAALHHPNIIEVYDHGNLGVAGGYLAMEFVQGFTLRERLDKQGPLPSSLAADWFDQICEGLKSAHRLRIIHRDLKPENIFICDNEKKRGVVKLFDFGLAKARESELSGSNITTPGMVLGTLGYMPPEQLMGEEADERSDIFSLGVMAAEALTGHRPFDGFTVMQLMASTLRDVFSLPGSDPASIALNEVLQRCLAKLRRNRFASVEEMQQVLIPAIRNYRRMSGPLAAGR